MNQMNHAPPKPMKKDPFVSKALFFQFIEFIVRRYVIFTPQEVAYFININKEW